MTGSDSNGGNRARGLVLKALVLIGGALLLKRFTKSTTRWDHARIVAESLCGEKFSQEQAYRNPDNYFNLRMLTCPATVMVDGSRVLYFEQAFGRTPQKPFRQRFYTVKPCSKDLKCDVELCSFAIRDAEEYKNFCDRQKDQRPHPEEVIGNGATYCTSQISVLKNGEVHYWDRGYDDEGNQVWGVKEGPYEFKPAPSSKANDIFSTLNVSHLLSLEKNVESSFAIQEQ